MSAQFLQLHLADFLVKVKGSGAEGRVDKAVALFTKCEVIAAEELVGARVATVVTGAGISVSAGAPAFRFCVRGGAPLPLAKYLSGMEAFLARAIDLANECERLRAVGVAPGGDADAAMGCLSGHKPTAPAVHIDVGANIGMVFLIGIVWGIRFLPTDA